MSHQICCEQLTRRGRPCRNPALPNSNPPRCARHRAQLEENASPVQLWLPTLSPAEYHDPATRPPADSPARLPEAPVAGPPAAVQLYLPTFSPEELDELELDGLSPDLRHEVQAVRVVMLRLLRLWNDPAQPIAAEEARRLAALVFSGARTVAHLLSRPTKDAGTADWFAQALAAMGDKHGLDL
jgi:hypothetical protein